MLFVSEASFSKYHLIGSKGKKICEDCKKHPIFVMQYELVDGELDFYSPGFSYLEHKKNKFWERCIHCWDKKMFKPTILKAKTFKEAVKEAEPIIVADLI